MEMEVLSATNSAEFTTEQKQYLLGFFAGAMQRGAEPFAGQTAAGLIPRDSASSIANRTEKAEETYHGTPVSDLCREELWKYERNPLDVSQESTTEVSDRSLGRGQVPRRNGKASRLSDHPFSRGGLRAAQ
jgi:hypothetical protein